MSARRGSVLIMAGGTGGHVFPALAVAQVLRARGIEVVWLGVATGMEARVVPAHGFAMQTLRIGGIRGKGLATLLGAPFVLLRAVLEARAVMRRVRPRVVLGAGGYVSGPGGIAAWLLGIPLVIHEQNAVAGLTNRWLARIATEVLEAFPGSFGRHITAHTIGNPVRGDIVALPAPAERFAARLGRIRLLVFGGSQGAQRLNAVMPEALARLDPTRRPEVRHQTGERGLESARAAYRERNVEAEVVPFIEDMAAAYAWADLALCRAGAMTVTELEAAGLGAVLVPLAVATDDHQTKNAQVLASLGACRLLPERELSAESLSACLAELTADRARLLKMAQAARGARITDAADRLADRCLALGSAA
ncbi:MAG TPA: undecaprenyldiphospho-muramoylpentapeptide beta-N-acetylglucosaminyltransferase [Steroidobacteraceae bacterium]|nr:undecaprenyldiphospho-muramoylpentapeptide beta-N-acetylglucosaminyltransferase [Steroidobacteraceae bacterium]